MPSPQEVERKSTQLDNFEKQMMELTREIERSASERKTNQTSPTQGGQQTANMPPPSQEKLSGDHEALSAQFREFSREISSAMEVIAEQLKRKNAIESANERLFDAMHGELKSYKEATIFEVTQKPFLLDLVMLKDDITAVSAQISQHLKDCPPSIHNAAHNLDNALHFIDEMLARHSVEPISVDKQMDTRECRVIETRHTEGDNLQPGDILEVKRCGYRWRGRILRPVNVVVKAHPTATHSTQPTRTTTTK